MKPRARRIAFLTVVAGCLVVGGLLAFNLNTVRDHVEAWWFQATTETSTMVPLSELKGKLGNFQGWPPTNDRYHVVYRDFLRLLANYSGVPVLWDSQADFRPLALPPLDSMPPLESLSLTDEVALLLLRARGYRIIEQRFPRRAYVVTGYPAIEYELPQRLRGGR